MQVGTMGKELLEKKEHWAYWRKSAKFQAMVPNNLNGTQKSQSYTI